MSLSLEMITTDCADPQTLAAWWAEAVGGKILFLVEGDFIIVVREGQPALGFQRVPDPTPGKNRMHLDFMTSDLEGEVARLVGLGASEIDRHAFHTGIRWAVMADPAGNVFCVAAPRD
ncbi:MAG: VOC family protein [Mycobacterium sp.]|nr:VOC family protein [Mycobacterium sp.]